MEYLYIGVIIFLILVIVSLFIYTLKSKNNTNETEKLKLYLKDEYNNLKIEMLKLVNESSKFSQTELFKNINNQFETITNKVNTNINESFKKTDQTFVNVVERLTKIDEQNKNINKLSTEVLTLNNILTDKSTRGTFGEVQLNKLLESVLGKNKELYEIQKTLSNNKKADAVIYAPKPLGMISIDSKFPLENYQKMIDHNLTKEEQDKHKKLFNGDLKKHIKDIKDKYIITNETANQAIMFIPAESIYLELVSNYIEVINYAYNNNIWITSPTTLISTLTIIETVNNSVKQNEQTSLLVEELKYLANEFRKYKERWEQITRRIEGLNKDINELNITNNYIYNKFKEIEQGKLD